MTAISKNAFRDNKLTAVTLPEYVTEIGDSAFANNQLSGITLPPNLKRVGREAFSGNRIEKVQVPAALTEGFGPEVFSNNKRWVVLEKADKETPLPAAVKSAKYASGFGQVAAEDAVSITVNYVDADTDKPLRSPQILQSEFTEPDGVYFAGAPNKIKAPVFTGYEATESSKEFTPVKGEKNEVTFSYKKTDFSPKISGKINKFIPYGGKGDAKALLAGVSATDTDGGDITASLTVSPKSVNTNVQDASYDVYYTATDSQGRTKTVKGKVAVGTDWPEKTICPGWQVKDFIYDGGTITGFSSTGYDKHRAGKTKDPWCWPTFGDKGQPIYEIGYKAFSDWDYFKLPKLTRLPESWGNVDIIGESAFASNQITALPDSWGKVDTIDESAFENNQITALPDSWGKVTSIGKSAFENNQITALPDSWGNITSIGGDAFSNNQISRLPDSWGNITTIGWGAFSNNQIPRLPDSWGKLTTIGSFAFQSNRIVRLPDFWGNITSIGDGAFSFNQIVRLPDSWGDIKIIGGNAFYKNRISRLPDSWGWVDSIGYSAFENNQITALPDSWGWVHSIDESAFKNNKITALPDSWGEVDSIDESAFENNQITALPDSWGEVDSIGKSAFKNNKITALPDYWGDIKTIGGSAFESNRISRLPDSWGNIASIEDGTFDSNGISRLPDSWGNITYIGKFAFYSNGISRLPDSWGNIRSIRDYAFYSNGISRLPDSWGNIRSIRDYAFYSNGISRLPDSWGNITSIGKEAFSNNQLTQLPKSLGKIFSLGNKTFPNTVPAGQIFTVPDERLENPSYDRREDVEGKCEIDYEKDEYVYNRLQLAKDYFSASDLAGLKAPIYLVSESGVNRCKVTGIPGRIVILGNTNVHIQYQDFNGNPVRPPQDVNVRFDESNAKGEYVFSAPPVEGYVLPKSQTVAVDGIDKTITFKYLKETKIHIEYSDTNGKKLRPAEDISLTEENGDEAGKYTIKAPQIYGYTKPDPQTIILDGKPKNIVFEYKKIPSELLKTYGYLNLVGKKIINKTGKNTELQESQILEDAIGQKLRTDLSFGGVEGASEVKDGYIEIKYDPVAVEYVEAALASVQGFTEVKVSAPGMLRIKLKPNFNFSRSVEMAIHWRLKPYVSAANKAYPLTAQLYDTDSEGNGYLVPPHRLSRPGPVYLKGYYQLPTFDKTVGGCKDHCTVYLPNSKNNPSEEISNTVTFGFETNNLHRNVEGYTITDQLPTYTKADGTTALAQFEAAENPGWKLESDQKTLTYSINVDDTDPLKGSLKLANLKLNFPEAKTFESIQNHASFVLTPQDQGENEPLITGNASTTFSFRPQPEPHPDNPAPSPVVSWVHKNAQGPHQFRGQTVIYDTKQDRNQEIVWNLSTDSSQVDGKSITVEDYNLDERLLYTGIKPDPLFVGGTLEILSSTGEKEKVIYTQTINDNSRLEIPYEVAKYHQIWLRLTAKPTVSDRVQTKTEVYSKLRDPSKVLCTNNNCEKIPALTNWVKSGSDKDRAEIKILPEGKTLKALKTSNYENLTVTGKSGIYTVGAEMGTDYADPLTNFKLIDILPRGLEIKSINLTGAFATLPGARYEIVTNFKETGQTAIIFEADQVSEPQDIYTVAQIETFITRGAPDGQFTNQAFVQAVGKIKYVNQIKDPIAGNGLWSRAEVKKVVSAGTDTFVSAWIRHNNSRSPWTQEISTVAGQKFFYQLRAAVGKKDEKHPVIYDLLPVEGAASRPGSTLINQYDSKSKITFEMGNGKQATGWKTFYTCDTGITRDDLATATWYDKPSCGNVTGLKFENPQALKARTEVRITIPMIAGPKGADVFSSVHNGKQALNDFTYSSDASYLALASSPVINTLTPPKVNIEFQKYGIKFMPFQGAEKLPLAGAKFGLFNKEEQLVNTAISGKDGKVSFKNVDAAPDWTIREIQAPSGYGKWDKKYVLSKDDFKTYDAGTASYQIRKNPVINMGTGLVIEPVKGTIEFQKVDKTGRPLSGIEFTITPQRVKQNDGSIVAPNSAPITLRSNSDGKVKFYNIPAGKWRLTENPGERHLQPISPIDFTITHCSGKGCTPTRGLDLKLGENGKVTNDKGSVSLSKLGVRGMADKKKVFGQWQRSDGVITGGASFKLYKGSKDTDPNPREFTTGSDGQKNFILEDLDLDQVYTLEETVPPAGYIKNDALLQFQIDAGGKLRDASGKKQLLEQSELLVPNEEQKKQSSLVVTKVDPKASEAEKYLADAEFGLFKQDEHGNWSAAPIKKVATDATGQAEFTGLSGGVYRVKELKAPKGYYVDSQAQHEFVVDDYKAQQFTWTASNERCRLRVFKFEPLVRGISEDAADKVVSGTPGAIKIPSQVAGTFNVVIPLKGAEFSLYENDETTLLAESLVTDKDGYVEVPATVKLDQDKIYKLKETKAPADYILKSNPISVKVSDYALLKGFTGLVTVEVPNTKDTGRVTVSKLSKETGKPLAGAEFTLTAPDGTKKTLVTNDVGLATFTGLTFGSNYSLQETKAPDGYQIFDKPEPVYLTADNPVRTYKVYNQLSGTWVELKKVSDTGTPIKGVVFELSRVGASAPAQTLTTGKGGKVKFKVIPGENYILKETQTSRGFALLPQPVNFTVDGNEKVTITSGKGNVNTVRGGKGSLTVINYPEGKLPLSGYAGALEVLLLGCLVLGIAIVFTLFERKRK